MWTLEVIAHFKGHQSKIRSISWSADDSRIMSCGLEGCVYEYNVRTFKRETELSAPNVTFNQAIYTHDNKLAFAIGSDGVLRELSDGHVFREFSTKLPLKHIAVTRNGKIALASTANHTLRALKYPFPQENPYEYTEYSYHTGPINRLCLSYDDQYAFTCGEDGCLWFFRLSEKEARAAKREKDYGYSDEV
ncbi:WD40-repeat-containing domain protein [Fimicolochytrium jonesii]|uniref:WD40-repeat-containing domain protein n=1 Tax=Fimicolochytrium jonesii TaxID=1396493 RepID=UPI0022FF07AB|nr:WD40-repeat-containing domain protein [Fimicolochytrium jonesii]KAI8824226.1 WD40-repeat-containing domain protein [Fimicolochytrium jonesii]